MSALWNCDDESAWRAHAAAVPQLLPLVAPKRTPPAELLALYHALFPSPSTPPSALAVPTSIESPANAAAKPCPKATKPPALLSSAALTAVMRYKLSRGQFRPSLLSLAGSNSDSAAAAAASDTLPLLRALARGHPARGPAPAAAAVAAAMAPLCALKGVGPATASLILSWLPLRISDGNRKGNGDRAASLSGSDSAPGDDGDELLVFPFASDEALTVVLNAADHFNNNITSISANASASAKEHAEFVQSCSASLSAPLAKLTTKRKLAYSPKEYAAFFHALWLRRRRIAVLGEGQAGGLTSRQRGLTLGEMAEALWAEAAAASAGAAGAAVISAALAAATAASTATAARAASADTASPTQSKSVVSATSRGKRANATDASSDAIVVADSDSGDDDVDDDAVIVNGTETKKARRANARTVAK